MKIKSVIDFYKESNIFNLISNNFWIDILYFYKKQKRDNVN